MTAALRSLLSVPALGTFSFSFMTFCFPCAFLFSLFLLLAVNHLGNSMDDDNVSLCSVGYPGGNRPVQSPSTITPQHRWPESNFARHSPGSFASHGIVNPHLIAHGQGASRRSSFCNEDTSYSQAQVQMDPRLSRPVHRNSFALGAHPPPGMLDVAHSPGARRLSLHSLANSGRGTPGYESELHAAQPFLVGSGANMLHHQFDASSDMLDIIGR